VKRNSKETPINKLKNKNKYLKKPELCFKPISGSEMDNGKLIKLQC
jgi:hypothetical protein